MNKMTLKKLSLGRHPYSSSPKPGLKSVHVHAMSDLVDNMDSILCGGEFSLPHIMSI